MNITHKFALVWAYVMAALFSVGALTAAAQNYPTKPIRVVVPFPAGGTSDILARLIGAKLTESWGQQIIVDSRPGANGNIGAELVARTPPDMIAKINSEVARILNLPDVKDRLASQGTTPLTNSPQEMGKWLAAEKDRWAKLIKDTGFRLDQ